IIDDAAPVSGLRGLAMSTDDDRRPYLDRRQLLSAAAALAAGGGASFATAESRSSAAPPAGPATVLITGANRGIGLEFARQYGERGYRVLATCREPAAAAELAALSARHPGMVVERLDVLDHPGIDAL